MTFRPENALFALRFRRSVFFDLAISQAMCRNPGRTPMEWTFRSVLSLDTYTTFSGKRCSVWHRVSLFLSFFVASNSFSQTRLTSLTALFPADTLLHSGPGARSGIKEKSTSGVGGSSLLRQTETSLVNSISFQWKNGKPVPSRKASTPQSH